MVCYNFRIGCLLLYLAHAFVSFTHKRNNNKFETHIRVTIVLAQRRMERRPCATDGNSAHERRVRPRIQADGGAAVPGRFSAASSDAERAPLALVSHRALTSSSSDACAPAAAAQDALIDAPELCARMLKCFHVIDRTVQLLRSRNLPLHYGLIAEAVEVQTGCFFSCASLAALLGLWPEAFTVSVADDAPTPAPSGRAARLASFHDWLLAPPPGATTPVSDHQLPSAERAAELARRLEAWSSTSEAPAAASRACRPPLPTASLPPMRRVLETRPAWDGAADGRAGAADGRAGAADGRAGAADGRAGAADGRAGAAGGKAVAYCAQAASGAAAPPKPTKPTAAAAAHTGAGVPVGCAGLSASLVSDVLERQQRQAHEGIREQTTRRNGVLTRLPEVARAVRSCMHEADRKVMPEAELVSKLTLNGRWLTSASELREQIAMLAKLVPEWCTVTAAGDQRLVRIVGTVRFADMGRLLEKAIANKVSANEEASANEMSAV